MRDDGVNIVVFNSTPEIPRVVPYTIMHETTGHVGERGISAINNHNKKLLKDWDQDLLVDYDKHKNALDYMFKIYSNKSSELRGMLMPSVYQMQRQGLTGKQLLESKYAKTDMHLENYRFAKGDEWVADVLDKLLAVTPIVGTAGIKYNNLTNNE